MTTSGYLFLFSCGDQDHAVLAARAVRDGVGIAQHPDLLGIAGTQGPERALIAALRCAVDDDERGVAADREDAIAADILDLHAGEAVLEQLGHAAGVDRL